MDRTTHRAQGTLQDALSRLERALRADDPYLLRDAAVTAWRALLSATDAFLQGRGVDPPASTAERRRALAQLERAEPQLAGLRLRERLAALERLVYQDAFVERCLDPQALARDIRQGLAPLVRDLLGSRA